MDLVIVIVSFNTRELLGDCLRSVSDSLGPSNLSGVVWVVDNASSDGSASMVERRFPDVRIVALDENVGFAAANNLALDRMGFGSEVTPRHVLFLNPDTRIVGGALETMVAFLDGAEPAGAAGSRLLYADGSFQHSAFGFPDLKQIFFDFFPIHRRLLDSKLNGRYPRRRYEAGEPFEVDHPLGAALMVRAAALARAGGFDERFFIYCEEIDLCRRIKAAGWTICCVPQAQIVHLGGQSTGQFRQEMFVALWRSRFLLFEAYENRCFCWAARRIVRMGLAVQGYRAKRAHSRGDIDHTELEDRLCSYREVRAL